MTVDGNVLVARPALSASRPPRKRVLLWLDLETTGLDPVRDVIIEYAARVTDLGVEPLTAWAEGVV